MYQQASEFLGSYVVTPCLVVHDGGAEAPGRVDARAGDGDGRQVHHEHREPNRQRQQHLHTANSYPIISTHANHRAAAPRTLQIDAWVEINYCYYRDEGVARGALGVGGGEDGVHEDERAGDLGAEGRRDGEPAADRVRAAAQGVVEIAPHDALHHARAADGAQALRHDVQHGAHQRQLPPHEQPERHGRVYVPACMYSACMLSLLLTGSFRHLRHEYRYEQ